MGSRVRVPPGSPVTQIGRHTDRTMTAPDQTTAPKPEPRVSPAETANTTKAALAEPQRGKTSGRNANGLPILVAGGGIGGLAAAVALARQGFPVRVFEQAPEFKELGAGIQLGPNIFRAIERVGLKAGMMDDAWVPPSIEMRDAHGPQS